MRHPRPTYGHVYLALLLTLVGFIALTAFAWRVVAAALRDNNEAIYAAQTSLHLSGLAVLSFGCAWTLARSQTSRRRRSARRSR